MDLTPIDLPPLRRHAPSRTSGVVLAATVGRESLDERLAAVPSLRDILGRGDVLLVDDGTLAGADRVRLARACGDPEFLPTHSAQAGSLPQDPEWALLGAVLDARRAAYCLLVGSAPPIEFTLPELLTAIASNRSFAVLDNSAVPEELEPHLRTLVKDDWPYLQAAHGLIGLAAGGEGRTVLAAVHRRIEAIVGAKRAGGSDMARAAANFILARERHPVLVRDSAGTVHSPGRI